ncbi:MAG: rhomboid family intramembrane serine protease [Candidatus Rokubacteria bacterium]|nr:rhomboid family intramembrane serine protease [Candidatus Rokubacteria bacterium]
MRAIRIAATSAQAEEWALVLTAAGIPNAVEAMPDGWALLAPADDAPRAHAALAAFDDERRAVAAAPEAPAYPWMTGVAAGLLLLWLSTMTTAPAWAERGAAAAGRIVAGEVWRAITALTLHLDMVHVTGNAVGLAVLLPPLVQRFGAGVALLLLVLTGAVGNVLAAFTHDARHVAVGASTAIFGAVAILAALRVMDAEPAPRGKRWTAPVAGVVLLMMLGTARGSDLAAHAFGFGVGAVVGVIASRAAPRRLGAITQWTVGGLVGLFVAVCWRLALRV